MEIRQMEMLSQQAKDKGLVPRGISERGTVMSALGLSLYTMNQLMEIHGLMLGEDLQVWPYDLSVTYVDPQLQVGCVEIEYKEMMMTLSWWVDLESIREAGLSPLLLPDGKMIDMAFLCEEQAQEMYNAMFLRPVSKEWPELSYHVKYVFDTLYHVKHQVPRTESYADHWIKSVRQAQVWMEHFIKLGYAKMKKVLDTNRYQEWCDSLIWIEANQQELMAKEAKKKNDELAKKLAAKL